MELTSQDAKFHAKRFLRIWFLLFASYLPLRIIYNLAVYGWLELRLFAAFEVILLPLGQAVVFSLVTAPFARKSVEATPPACEK